MKFELPKNYVGPSPSSSFRIVKSEAKKETVFPFLVREHASFSASAAASTSSPLCKGNKGNFAFFSDCGVQMP